MFQKKPRGNTHASYNQLLIELKNIRTGLYGVQSPVVTIGSVFNVRLPIQEITPSLISITLCLNS